MERPPLLLTVKLALPLEVLAIQEISELVNDFLMPFTIDGAVYNELPLILQIYERFLPYTGKAMDGAAKIGRLDILHRLQQERTEGCSTAAFIGAATNNHLQVLQWLYHHYGELSDSPRVITEAVAHGHIRIVHYLRDFVWGNEATAALETAAANGFVNVVDELMDRPIDWSPAIAAVVVNEQTRVMQYFLDHGGPQDAHFAMVKAAEHGRVRLVELLLGRTSDRDIGEALYIAAKFGRVDVVRLLLERSEPNKKIITLALGATIKYEHFAVIEVLLEDYPLSLNFVEANAYSDKLDTTDPVQDAINVRFLSAVMTGRIQIVQVLFEKVGVSVKKMLDMAATSNNAAVMEVVLELCRANHFNEENLRKSVAAASEVAAFSNNAAVAQLLVEKYGEYDSGNALSVAIKGNPLTVAKLFVRTSSVTSKTIALVRAAAKHRIKFVKALLPFSTQDAIKWALFRAVMVINPFITEDATKSALFKAALVRHIKMTKLLLEACDPSSRISIFTKAATEGACCFWTEVKTLRTGRVKSMLRSGNLRIILPFALFKALSSKLTTTDLISTPATIPRTVLLIFPADTTDTTLDGPRYGEVTSRRGGAVQVEAIRRTDDEDAISLTVSPAVATSHKAPRRELRGGCPGLRFFQPVAIPVGDTHRHGQITAYRDGNYIVNTASGVSAVPFDTPSEVAPVPAIMLWKAELEPEFLVMARPVL